MFYGSRENVARTLEDLRFDLCCYMSRHFCDCKYGYEPEKTKEKPIGSFGYHNHGEQTGCPELRTVVGLLSLMTDEEFNEIMQRGRNIKV